MNGNHFLIKKKKKADRLGSRVKVLYCPIIKIFKLTYKPVALYIIFINMSTEGH